MNKKDKQKPLPNPSRQFINEKILFSFEFYDTSWRYCFSALEKNQLQRAISRLKEVSQKQLKEMYEQRATYHFHPVDWNKTSEKNGFPDSKVNQLEAYQFALLGVNGQKTRVFGGFAERTFYIVWIDLEHKVDPTFKK